MIPDDGRKWGRDRITITLTRRQWIIILRALLPYTAWGTIFRDDYFTHDDTHRAAKSLERQLPEVKEQLSTDLNKLH